MRATYDFSLDWWTPSLRVGKHLPTSFQDDDDDDDDEEDDDDIRDDVAWKANVSKQQQLPSGKPKASREAKQMSPVIDLLDQINGSDLLEYVGSDDNREDYLEELRN